MAEPFIINVPQLFQQTFGSLPLVVKDASTVREEDNNYSVNDQKIKAEQEFTQKGSLVKEMYRNVQVLLPIRFYNNDQLLIHLPYCTITECGSEKGIVRTALPEQIGTVKEQFNIDDYKFSVSGFLISTERIFPEAEIDLLRQLYETGVAITMDNALSNIFLSNNRLKPDEQRRVVVTGFKIIGPSAGREHVIAFTMQIEADTVFTLELE